MTLITIKKGKNTRFLLSEQVKTILQEKGFLKVFNYSDFQYYKLQAKTEFNKALAIAEKFIADNESENLSDFNSYIF